MGIMLVYDITNEKSFENIVKWLRNINEVSFFIFLIDLHKSLITHLYFGICITYTVHIIKPVLVLVQKKKKNYITTTIDYLCQIVFDI